MTHGRQRTPSELVGALAAIKYVPVAQEAAVALQMVLARARTAEANLSALRAAWSDETVSVEEFGRLIESQEGADSA